MLSDQITKFDHHEHDVPKKRSPALIALVVMAAVLAALLSVSDGPAHKSAVSAAAVRLAPKQEAAPADNWTYTSHTVELTGDKQDLACTSSPEGARLCFRETQGQLESFLAFPEGDKQFLCTKYHCATQIRVDNQPVIKVDGRDSPDGNIAVVYLGQPEQLLAALRTARHAELGPPMYEQDGLVLHFNVSGLRDFDAGSSHRSAAVVSRTPAARDRRLSVPITPVQPPVAAQPKLSSTVTIRFGLA